MILFKDKFSEVFAAVYMTGILPIKKYNTQSALNNLIEYSMVDPGNMAPFFGFTKEESKQLAIKYNLDFYELEKWYDAHIEAMPDSPFIKWERDAILELFADWDYFKLQGGALRLDGRIIAFTFGEQLNTDTVVVHVEKADPNIRGAYPAINQGFVANCWAGMTYINREEDMGEPGLRKAKESYKPEKMIEKYNAVWQG